MDTNSVKNKKTVFFPALEMLPENLGVEYKIITKDNIFVGSQYHDYHEISLVASGRLRCDVADTSYELEAGDLLWLRPGDIHCKYMPLECRQINLSFKNDMVENFLCFLNDENFKELLNRREHIPPLRLSPKDNTRIQEQVHCLMELSPRQQDSLRSLMFLLFSRIAEIYFNEIVLSAGSPSLNSGNAPLWFSALLTEVDRQRNLKMTAEDMAAITGRNKSYICRCFKRYLGLSPAQYICRLRLEYAENLLLHTDREIMDIMFESGYENLSHFYHQFKRKNNCSPAAFRKNYSFTPRL